MTALVYVLIILILIGIAVQISKNILRKEFGLYIVRKSIVSKRDTVYGAIQLTDKVSN